MRFLVIATLFTIAFGRCADKSVSAVDPNEPLTIRTGTSFGMCMGYCLNDYAFNGTRVTLTQSGTRTQAQNPARTCQNTISSADWNTLKASANFDAFGKQAETLGCPDCADGGAEYIELQLGDSKHRVTFEYGKTIPGFEPLVEALRKQRAAFKTCP